MTALLHLRRKCVLGNFITHKNPPSSVGLEPATEYPVGSVASTVRCSLFEIKNHYFWKLLHIFHLLLCVITNSSVAKPVSTSEPNSESSYLVHSNKTCFFKICLILTFAHILGFEVAFWHQAEPKFDFVGIGLTSGRLTDISVSCFSAHVQSVLTCLI
jgi:hypothetical protein